MLRKIAQLGIGGIAGALMATILGIFLLWPFKYFTLGSSLVRLSYDLPFLILPYQPVEDLVLVYMDDDSHQNLNQPYNAGWDRAKTHARLLQRLKADGAKAAIFDILFTDPTPGTNKQADEIFARAIKDFGKVVLGAEQAGDVGKKGLAGGNEIVPPYDTLADAATALGTVEIPTDPDLVARHHLPHLHSDIVPSLPWAAAELVKAPIVRAQPDWGKNCWIRYYGPPDFLPGISYHKALDLTLVPAGFFRNKVVFIGSKIHTSFSGQRKDEYPTPYRFLLEEGKQYMPGVEVQATRFLNLMRQDWLSHIAISQENAIVVLCAVLFGLGLILVRPLYAALIGFSSVLAVAGLNYYLVSATHTWFAWLIVDLEIATAMLWSIIYNSVLLYVQKRLMEQSLSMYVSPSRAKQILKRPDILKPGAEKQELSILFSDIANFTAMSEGMDSDQLAKFMNGYFDKAVSKCLHPTDGTVVKYIGDAIFAIWNAPEPQKNHQELACRGALLMRDKVSTFDDPRLKSLGVRTRIGLHSGVANVGNFGSSTRIDYTAFGENVNLASRMEGLNKYIGTGVVITGDVEQAVRGKFVTRLVGQFQLKGFEKAVDVYELIDLPDAAETTRPWREAFESAIKAFCEKKWDEAQAAFECVLKIKPEDGPAKYYLKQIAELRQKPPEVGWSGEIELKEK